MGIAKTVTATEKPYLTLDDLAVAGRIALVRGDLNVPTERDAAGNWQVTDKTRLVRLAPTLRELADQGARVVVLSHFGRPKGGADLENSLRPVAPLLAQILGRPVHFAEDCVGEKAAAAIAAAEEGAIVLLENVRFHAGEEKNDAGFARSLAALGDLYVNDAFSAAHRAHASTCGIAAHLPSCAGRHLQAELEALSLALENPPRPVAAIVGGAKISTKLDLLGNLLPKVDCLILGGAMANTFWAAQGVSLGQSLIEPDMFETARRILETAKARGTEIVLPVDGRATTAFSAETPMRIVPMNAVPADHRILDIGPETEARIQNILRGMKTLLWNGPMGAFELAPYASGTVAVARSAAELTQRNKLKSIAGGGDTLAALAVAGVTDAFTYVSTAGGAFLEWLEGKELPGLTALKAAAQAR